MSKAELIKAYKQGQLKDSAVHTMTNTSAAVIVHIDDHEEKVFGYIAGGSEKQYFYVKYRHLADDTAFNVWKMNFRFSQFMRINRP